MPRGAHPKPFDLLEQVPPELRGLLLPWAWDLGRLWALSLPTELIPLAPFEPLLALPYWRDREGRPFRVRPLDVLARPEQYPDHAKRMRDANLDLPIHLTEHGGRTIVLDGMHRIAQGTRVGRKVLPGRRVDGGSLSEILVGYADGVG
ncbi:hypothetical protein [Pendulispora albinea]|uniref:ParB/Sulfiredoxin domain-containing protein n=1 Tax=Pendulispora albinea TaxID=2741071 RepID=A0ABZ2M7C7_9BACT